MLEKYFAKPGKQQPQRYLTFSLRSSLSLLGKVLKVLEVSFKELSSRSRPRHIKFKNSETMAAPGIFYDLAATKLRNVTIVIDMVFLLDCGTMLWLLSPFLLILFESTPCDNFHYCLHWKLISRLVGRNSLSDWPYPFLWIPPQNIEVPSLQTTKTGIIGGVRYQCNWENNQDCQYLNRASSLRYIVCLWDRAHVCSSFSLLYG